MKTETKKAEDVNPGDILIRDGEEPVSVHQVVVIRDSSEPGGRVRLFSKGGPTNPASYPVGSTVTIAETLMEVQKTLGEVVVGDTIMFTESFLGRVTLKDVTSIRHEFSNSQAARVTLEHGGKAILTGRASDIATVCKGVKTPLMVSIAGQTRTMSSAATYLERKAAYCKKSADMGIRPYIWE